MKTNDTWTTIHGERRALADDLRAVADAQWTTPSLCPEWTVREVLGHMAGTAQTTFPKFVGGMLAAGFRFQTFLARRIAEQVEGTPADTLARFEAVVTSTDTPVPGPLDGWLGETIVHAEDIRRPLGISHAYPMESLVRLAGSYTKNNVGVGGKKHVAGLTLRATDTDWTHGDGLEVTGPMLSLLLVIAGRDAGLADLNGEGTSTLAAAVRG